MGFSTNAKLLQKLKEVFSFLDNLTPNKILKWSSTLQIETSGLTEGEDIAITKPLESSANLFSRGVSTGSFSSNTAILDIDQSETFNHYIIPTPSYEFNKSIDNSTFTNSRFPSIKYCQITGTSDIYILTNLRDSVIHQSQWNETMTIPKNGIYEVTVYTSNDTHKKVLFTFDLIVNNILSTKVYEIHAFNSINGDIISYQSPDILTFKNYRVSGESSSQTRNFYLSSKLITSLETI